MNRLRKLYAFRLGAKSHFYSAAERLLMPILFCLLISLGARAHTNLVGKVISVIDGNTIEVSLSENKKLTVLLEGIDCPEMGQEYGRDAKAFLEEMVLKKDVELEIKGRDRSGNHIAIVKVANGVDLRVELLKEGLAWTSENGSKDLEPYKTWAQRKGKGLWKQHSPVPPWTYRRQQAMAKPKIR